MLLFKEIEFNKLHKIQQKILNLLPKWIYEDDFKKFGSGVLSMPEVKQKILMLDEIKDLQECLSIQGCINTIRFSLAQPNQEYTLHIDGQGPHVISLNIPIFGFEKTYINFYKPYKDIKRVEYKDFNTKKNYYLMTADKKDCELISSYETKNCIYAMRTDVLHEVTPPKQLRLSVLLRLVCINNIEEL